jgi:assimilatory nitrate reductase catalytic subunit
VLDNRTRRHVIVVDPRVTKTAMLADQHLAVRPRSDITLLNGIIKVLLDEGLVDLDRVRQVADGLDELVDHVQAFDLDRVERECGVAAAEVRGPRWPSAPPSGPWWPGPWA